MKKTLPMRVLAVVLCVAMLVTVTPIFAAAESATYLDYNATTGKVDTVRTVDDIHVIDDSSDSFVTGWNIVKGDVEYTERILLPEDVNLILANGATLTADKGISVSALGDFSVYAQSNDAATMGKLIALVTREHDNAAIGTFTNGTCGNISIYGGTVTAKGGRCSAAIGSGSSGGVCGDIAIYGGIVTAQSGSAAAGIGSGMHAGCSSVTIMGGIVTAQSDSQGAGIGSGCTEATCGLITISGGVVTAQGGDCGAGIGSGEQMSSCDGITISGGAVDATGGTEAAGIGGGGAYSSCGKVTITGGRIKATRHYNALPIGISHTSSFVEVSIDPSCTSVENGDCHYINCDIPAKAPTCTVSGYTSYFVDPVSNIYYRTVPFETKTLIGNDEALAAWKAQGGAGYVAPLGHDWALSDNDIHACTRCEATGEHTDADEDLICDICKGTLTPNVPYLDYNPVTGAVDTECGLWKIHEIDEATDSFVNGWNVVKGSVEFENRLTLTEDVKLILENGATMTAKKGIELEAGVDFTVYAQSNDADTMGKLIVPGADTGYAGIGSADSSDCGAITIYGGNITAQGGTYGAGIGSGNLGDCGDITIRGGIVTATNGNNGAGIGGGFMSDCGNITISGGIVSAVSNQNAAAIGSGYYSDSCGIITISGGIVAAESKNFGAGIGSGSESPCDGVVITGGRIKATSARNAEPIGKGEDSYGEDDTPAVQVSIAPSCTSVIVGKTQCVNCELPAKAPTCTESGYIAYFIEPVSNLYYTAVPFTEDTLIGDDDALAAWKAEGGAGYVAPLPHTDENEDNVCDVCKATATPYLDYNATTGTVDTEHKVWSANVIDDATDSFVTGWNVVKGDVTFEDRLTLPKDVNLILENGATLTAKMGITVAADGDFAVYAQSNDEDTMGKLIVPGAVTGYAGIGTLNEGTCGDMVIYGGVVTAQGGKYGAGIGSGSDYASCGNITIYGGVVTAQGGQYGAGIGSGSDYASCGNISISGGVVNAQGGYEGAGIGSGHNRAFCGNIVISGGVVNAQGGYEAAGIGSGYNYTSCGDISIFDGIVNAQGGYEAAGIGSGFHTSCSDITIMGGYIKATPGEDAAAIGRGFVGTVGQVSIANSCRSAMIDGSQYINYMFFAVEPTCTESGISEYFIDPVTGNYYASISFTEDTLIGDATALAEWKAGEGVLPPLGHDWEFVDENTHKCTRCDATGAHTDEDKCDACHAICVTYLDYDALTGKVDTTRELWTVDVIDEATDSFVTGWNVVKGDVTFEDRLTLPKDVNLILTNGATLTAKKGITVAADGDFAVYAQSNDEDTMGKLIVPGADDYNAGIGALDEGVCGNISIYGGVVTAQGGHEGAGIGSGYYNASCGDISIFDGIVNAQGGYEAAGIGSGFHASCSDITIMGGYIKATPGEGAAAIGQGFAGTVGEVSIANSCTSAMIDGSQYINYMFFAVEPTCTESGVLEYFIDPVTGNYYTALPFTEAGLIGDATALAKWKAGEGVLPPLGHDWKFVDEITHKCTRCKATEAHTDADEDYICDECNGVLIETAKEDALAALNTAVGDNPSNELLEIASVALEKVSLAKTLEEVATEKENGLAAITAYLEALANAKTAAKAAFAEVAGETPSAAVQAGLDAAYGMIDGANTPENVATIKAVMLPVITAQVAAEDEFAATLEQLATEAAAAKQAVEEQLAQAQKDLAAANEALASKEATIAEKQEALDAATEQLNAANAALEAAKANIKALEGTVSEQDEALKQAKQDLEDKQAALDEMTANYNEAKAALDDTKKALSEANAANEQAKKDLAAANDTIAELNDTVSALNDTVANKDATIAEKQEALDAANEQLDAAKEALETAKANLKTAKANVEELEGTVSEQDEALKQAAKDLENAQKALAKAEQDVKDLQAEIERLKALLEDDPTKPTEPDPTKPTEPDPTKPTEPDPTKSDDAVLGDANDDGVVNMKDVLLMRKFLAGLDVSYNAKNADANEDGDVNMKDVLMLRKYLAGLIENLGA